LITDDDTLDLLKNSNSLYLSAFNYTLFFRLCKEKREENLESDSISVDIILII
jgi:hypothetical protein